MTSGPEVESSSFPFHSLSKTRKYIFAFAPRDESLYSILLGSFLANWHLAVFDVSNLPAVVNNSNLKQRSLWLAGDGLRKVLAKVTHSIDFGFPTPH